MTDNQKEGPEKFYSLKAEQWDGQEYDFEQLRGKVVLIVNVASKCGFTSQYDGLEKLHKDFGEKGLVVLGFPTNQFAGQEPGTDKEIQEFCSLTHGVKFPIMKKSDVNGAKENEVFKHIKKEKPGLLGFKVIKWNFEKFLVDRKGNIVERWASTSTPASMEKTIEKYLDQE
ncbi:Glutathione peroxidase 2 [Coemansia thaxteri]|uniref:Glutathione peroxidase n=1 Tax=Coemansia thaxteri TaxID=2663907 RepID=A0A9W8EDZ7_9FUNG|nr:Glutathione peroxidase 2 [Coemansia thaxteri]KAJ2008397.1 Glutathione peroxidase 2 [Coemansia thaxteri]KAJ2466531.1 Glutathione peroxidase 2 [Coemansia sp. RSA 2320]KAJ2471801.1 Glutathione peroxidase 2 [Coemansia sp. RSA 2322]